MCVEPPNCFPPFLKVPKFWKPKWIPYKALGRRSECLSITTVKAEVCLKEPYKLPVGIYSGEREEPWSIFKAAHVCLLATVIWGIYTCVQNTRVRNADMFKPSKFIFNGPGMKPTKGYSFWRWLLASLRPFKSQHSLVRPYVGFPRMRKGTFWQLNGVRGGGWPSWTLR